MGPAKEEVLKIIKYKYFYFYLSSHTARDPVTSWLSLSERVHMTLMVGLVMNILCIFMSGPSGIPAAAVAAWPAFTVSTLDLEPVKA